MEDLSKKIEELQKQLSALQTATQAQTPSPATQPDGVLTPTPAEPPTAVAAAPEPPTSGGGVEVASIQDGDATLRRLVQRIAMILQAEKVAIMFHERETGDLIGIPPSFGVDDHTLDLFKVRATQGISGQVFRESTPALYHNASTDPRSRKDMVQMLKVTNGITVPLIIEKRDEENRVVDRTTIGVLHAFNKRQGEDFNEEDVRLLERMARNVGSIIANLQLYKEVLHEREQLMQTFESLTSGLLLISPNNKLIQMNAVARNIFQVEDNPLGKDPSEVLKAEELVKFIIEGLEGRESPPFELAMDFHGAERHYDIQGALVRNEEARTLGFVVIINDVTEQKNIDRMKSNFVAMASHELRTPLTAIKGFSSTLLDGVDDDIYDKDQQKEFLGIVVSECDRLRRLIDDLLNTARIEAGQSLKPNYTRFEIRDLVEKVAMVQNQASPRHHVFVTMHDELPGMIAGDQDKMDQIFTNLLNNAIKYSPEGGDVVIHCKVEGEWLKFGIEDQGIGIPPDHLDKVFERFHRVNNEDNRKIYGTGLGLFLVKHLVEQVHMGKIWAESEVGKGSTFWFQVPKELDIEKARAMNDD
ncbi:MAG: ATP-binding protein [Fimbriimonadaceae bacterium]|nr:ATP-binding protein [Fimbriimonadaceae bacterium]